MQLRRVLVPLVIVAGGVFVARSLIASKPEAAQLETEVPITWVEVRVAARTDERVRVMAMGVVKPEFEKAHIHDVHIPEYIAWTPLLVGILLFGIFPHLLFDMIDPAVNVVTAGVDALGNAAAGAGR